MTFCQVFPVWLFLQGMDFIEDPSHVATSWEPVRANEQQGILHPC
jgi:hypothetical protein